MLPEEFIIKVKNYLNEVGIDIDTLTIRDLDDDYSDIDYSGFLCCNNIFRFNYGATRGCIIPIENDCSQPKFVFKFDFDPVKVIDESVNVFPLAIVIGEFSSIDKFC